MTTRRLLSTAALCLLACAFGVAGRAIGADPHSYANPEAWRVSHAALDLSVDFAARALHGHVDLRIERQAPAAGQVVLDTRDLYVTGVALDDAAGGWQALDYALGDADPILGRALRVSLPAGEASSRTLRVSYRTDPGASGLQWLAPEQTAGGRQPFLFTQSQAIHARSWVPLQDTPAVRMSYSATIRTSPELLAVMSAENVTERRADGVYRFRMPQPIPSYLLALAVGELEFASLGSRTGVYAEPAIIASAAAEFADTERMLQIGESLYGPYRWGRYDLLILPPSFPFGGMENPRLSFITPTVIAGDRSLVALIAHELAHSWSGNLATNASWNDLWLNEGFTTFFETRIMEAIYGERRARMEAVLGLQGLEADFADLPPQDQHLVLDLKGRDPDDGFSEVPYQKGKLLLDFLESRVGRAAFDEYLRGYFARFAFRSVSTATFLADLQQHLLAGRPALVRPGELDQWLHAPGLPATAVLPSSDAFERVAAERDAWLSGERAATELQTARWSVHEWLYLLNTLPATATAEQIADLDRAFGLTESTNNEIAHAWLLIAIERNYAPAYPRLERYLLGIGRNKLIKPLYKALMESPAGRLFAERVYAHAKPGYHPQTQSAIGDIVHPPAP